MSRDITIAVVQPASGPGAVEAGLRLLEEAATRGADIACLPEYFNLLGEPLASWPAHAEPAGGATEMRVRELAAQQGMYVVLPLARLQDGQLTNESLVVGSDGEVVGGYVKTHLARAADIELMSATAGDELPVFDLNFGRVGVMLCYDNYFPEVAATLARKGAEVVFYPHLQAGPSELVWETQLRARAVDHCLYVVACCPGVGRDSFWRPGMLFGRSTVVGPDGLSLCDVGRYEGMAVAQIDLDKPHLMDITHEGDVRDLRQLVREDRRPELYGALTEES
jgi:predicted amidohydrolase